MPIFQSHLENLKGYHLKLKINNQLSQHCRDNFKTLSRALREFASDIHVFCPKYMLNIGQNFERKILLISGNV